MVTGNMARNCQFRSKAQTALTAPFTSLARIGKCAMKKFSINCQLRNKHILIIIHRFSLVKAAMNSLRICKLYSNVNKTPPFLHFPIAKGGTKTIAQLSIAEGLNFRSLDRRIYDCKLRNEKKM
jgi:hypothetical protein